MKIIFFLANMVFIFTEKVYRTITRRKRRNAQPKEKFEYLIKVFFRELNKWCKLHFLILKYKS